MTRPPRLCRRKTSDEQPFEGRNPDNIDWSSLSYESVYGCVSVGFNREVQISPAKSIMSSAPAHPPIVLQGAAQEPYHPLPSGSFSIKFPDMFYIYTKPLKTLL